MYRSKVAIGVTVMMCACGGGSHPAALNHRPNDVQCSEPAAPGHCGCSGCNLGPQFTCVSDSSCTQGVNGRCTAGGAVAGCSCTYDACSGDSDCPSNQTCACHGSPYAYAGNQCISGNCRIDSDCGAGSYCSPSGDLSVVGYYCHTPQDTCINDDECTVRNCSGPPGEPRCVYAGSAGHWQCQCIPIPV
jgi:hypothetical protein